MYQRRTALLDSFPEVMTELGVDPLPLLRGADIDPESLHDSEALVPDANFVQLLTDAVVATGCGHLGLLLGERVSLQSFGLLGLLLRSASTVRQASQDLIDHLNVHAEGVTRHLHYDRGVAYLACVMESPILARSPPAIQMSVALTWKFCRLLTGNKWNPTSIYFSFDEPDDSKFYRQLFKVTVQFNRDFSGVVFAESDLETPLIGNDAFLHEEIKKQLQRLPPRKSGDFVADVKRCIRQNLEEGLCSIDSVVRYFPFEKRTFQGKLKAAGVSYQQLLDDVRFEKAEIYLQNSSIALSLLADMLGYKNSSVFSTAFKNRYGQSPSVWRKHHSISR